MLRGTVRDPCPKLWQSERCEPEGSVTLTDTQAQADTMGKEERLQFFFHQYFES